MMNFNHCACDASNKKQSSFLLAKKNEHMRVSQSGCACVRMLYRICCEVFDQLHFVTKAFMSCYHHGNCDDGLLLMKINLVKFRSFVNPIHCHAQRTFLFAIQFLPYQLVSSTFGCLVSENIQFYFHVTLTMFLC